MEFKYRVVIENEIEHIDFWEYKENEFELAKARYDDLELNKGEYKYILDLESEEILQEQFGEDYIYEKAEELAEKELCEVKCLCPKLKEQGLCSGCEVFTALREYYKQEILEEKKKETENDI